MVMAHSLTPATATATTPISGGSARSGNASFSPRVWTCHHQVPYDHQHSMHRRTLTLGLSGALVLGLSSSEQSASAARRPPPPPPEEKKDPNVSGVQAKVLASKKRKEAMKEAVAKLRDKGKPVQGPPQPQ